ncbi:hypothetical protein HAX54_031292, partial [Datura stramonium]|nr:hypothetical protein [Datura stramonium]
RYKVAYIQSCTKALKKLLSEVHNLSSFLLEIPQLRTQTETTSRGARGVDFCSTANMNYGVPLKGLETINDEFQINQFGATYLAASCPRMRGKTEFRFYIIRRSYREKVDP